MVEWYHQLNGHVFEQTLVMVKDREAWRAAVHGVTKSWTRLKQLSSSRSSQHIKNQRHYFATEGPSSQSYGFSSSHGCM